MTYTVSSGTLNPTERTLKQFECSVHSFVDMINDAQINVLHVSVKCLVILKKRMLRVAINLRQIFECALWLSLLNSRQQHGCMALLQH